MTLRIGYKASAEQFAPRRLLDYAVLAEEIGLESVWISDHFQPWRHHGGHAPYSLSWLAAVGERTERVQLGTSVMTPTFRYNPAVVAQAFGTLGSLYPGRIAMGVGTGEALNEIVVGSVDSGQWPDFKERFGRLRESVRLMRALWTGERVSFEGDYYHTVDATIYDKPDEPIPVYIAAGGPTVAKYAGRMGDGFICTSGKGKELYVDKLIPAVEEGLSLGKRDTIDRMIEIKLSWDPDHAKAVENCRFWAALSLTPEQKHGTSDPLEMEKLGDALSDEQIASRWIVSSDPDEVVAAVKQYVDWGFDHLVFHAPGDDQERFLRTFGEQVLPGLRELG
ncbi:coenzyme F420-dependent glucose-6-phosphate dehydrogenase [Branchiibius hedensis]|uniref:F420-dependent glucose-6-phosphate dehydrogenase n=1 Tax=Branchiibius hedensis TaxID=672460 RepID=A0A2Y8ZTD3_9MICO|nr:glucose-6-phosphate dehydrogenase (coenzyme-F420) [Branchiibius hedensis]PWJ26442.1 coenzyme F420-dependent glucose-6-phosphate dehydrogenase [Branchiibius hedensis]SSA35254.1 coenzyme F420-dependent glucose-6-phosphate dehydrogenase [Branchiibius hedensis]